MLERVLPYAKTLAREIVGPGDILVDATCGNGHDTKFLAELTGETGRVLSFDIQESAIKNAEALCSMHSNIRFILDSHENIDQYIDDANHIKAAMFNLGYLPRGDKSITTLYQSTITAIGKIFEQLTPSGRIIIVVYHGHPEGRIEKEELTKFLSEWPQQSAQVLEYRFINQRNDAPYILCIEKNEKSAKL